MEPMVRPAPSAPAGNASTAGTPPTMPTRASPSPRRSAGISSAVTAPPTGSVIRSGFVAVESAVGARAAAGARPAGGRRCCAQLQDQLRDAIRCGRLGGGERLPSPRDSPAQLVSVARARPDCYAQLEAEGYLASRAGSTHPRASAPSARPRPRSTAATGRFRHRLIDRRFPRTACPISLAPRQDWSWAMARGRPYGPVTAWDYGDPMGEPQLAKCSPRTCAGCGRSGRAGQRRRLHRHGPGARAGGPGARRPRRPPSPRRIRRRLGDTRSGAAAGDRRRVHVPVDDRGIDVAALGAPATAVFVTPAHQWPIGVVLTPERRHELIAWARRTGGLIIEDDYDAEFRYDRDPVGSMQGLAPDASSRSAGSKSLAPALRLGWLVARRARSARWPTGKLSPTVEPRPRPAGLRPADPFRPLRPAPAAGPRRVRRRAREALLAALTAHAPGLRVSGLAAGFHAVLHLPPAPTRRMVAPATGAGSASTAWHQCATRRGRAGRDWCSASATPRNNAIEPGIATIADLLQGPRR